MYAGKDNKSYVLLNQGKFTIIQMAFVFQFIKTKMHANLINIAGEKLLSKVTTEATTTKIVRIL